MVIEKFVCPHCGVLAQMDLMNRSESNIQDTKIHTLHNISRCHSCQGILYFATKHGIHSEEIVFHYPTANVTVHNAIPPNVAESYKQGLICLNAGSQIGAVICFRRSLQQICKLKNTTKRTLNDQIDEIFSDKVKSVAHEIREWGNLGAHPDDIIENLEDGDAEEIRDLLMTIFEDVYITPWNVEQRKMARGVA